MIYLDTWKFREVVTATILIEFVLDNFPFSIDMQFIQTREICQDTYMELKCSAQSQNSEIVILESYLVKEVDTTTCRSIVGRLFARFDQFNRK